MADTGFTPRREVPFKVTNPERIPAQRYYDQEFYDLECKYLWPYVWQMTARLEEIPEVGDWVEYKNLNKSAIIVRTKSGVKAFSNSCRHRGVQLASGGHGNCATQGFICPFHGWRYDMDGKNTFVFNKQIFSDEALEAGELNLVPIRCETWGGCAFINYDDNAAPLLDCIKPFAEWHDPRNVEKIKAEWWLACELPANWKLAMEAFQEGYHVMRSHPQLHAVTMPSKYNHGLDKHEAPRRAFANARELVETFIQQLTVVSVGMDGQIHSSELAIANDIKDKIDYPEDLSEVAGVFVQRLNDEITRRARVRGVPMPDLNTIPSVSPDNFCFPNYFLLPAFGAMSSYRIRPLGPERCLFEVYSLVLYPEDEQRDPPRLQLMDHDDPRWPPIAAQDFSNIPKQQLGLHAEGFKFMRLSRQTEGAISNYHRVIDGFLEGRDRQELLNGMQNACSEIDSPIKHDVFGPLIPTVITGLYGGMMINSEPARKTRVKGGAIRARTTAT